MYVRISPRLHVETFGHAGDDIYTKTSSYKNIHHCLYVIV